MEAVDTSKYAPDLVDAFVESIENSKNLLHNPSTITISDMKTAISNMETAYNNLVVDKSELEALINTAKNINSELYTDNSVQALRTTLENATNIYESDDSSYSDVQTQIEKLKTAANGGLPGGCRFLATPVSTPHLFLYAHRFQPPPANPFSK